MNGTRWEQSPLTDHWELLTDRYVFGEAEPIPEVVYAVSDEFTRRANPDVMVTLIGRDLSTRLALDLLALLERRAWREARPTAELRATLERYSR